MNIFLSILNFLFPSKLEDQKKIIKLKKQFWFDNWILSLFPYKNKKINFFVRHLKKYRDPILEDFFAREMYYELLEYISEKNVYSEFINPILVPIPLDRKRGRDYNQASILAEKITKNDDILEYREVLVKNKSTLKQALVKKKKDRETNIHGAFNIKKGEESYVRNRNIIIVDDLKTTGATLNEARRVLKKNGANDVIAITVAY